MQDFTTTPVEIFATHWRNRSLIKTLVKRDIVGRYRGSVLGLLWSFFNPLLMLSVYTFVFSSVLKARWSADNPSKVEFALVLFAGLIIFNFASDIINRSATIITSNTNYVKKVIFPLEVLSSVVTISALFHLSISLVVWLAAYIVFFGMPHPTIVFFPVILLPMIALSLGFSWFLASLGVYLRDVSQITGLVMTALMFMSPIFYPISALPAEIRPFIYLNPLTPMTEMTRDILYWGKAPNMTEMLIYTAITFGLAAAGFLWFQKTRKGFADVL